MTGTLFVLLRISRPYYILQAIAPPVAGYLATSQVEFSVLTTAAVGCVFGLLAMAAWAGNDLFDSELDSRGRLKLFHGLYVAGGTGLLRTRKLAARTVTTYMLLLISVALGLAAAISLPFLVLAGLCGLVGVFYSVPPVRLKTRGLFGAALTATSYGLVAFTAGCVAAGTQISIAAITYGVAMSVLVFGYDGIGHIIDYADDNENGLNTFAVQLGAPCAIKLLAACQVLPIMVLWILGLTSVLKLNLTGVAVLFLATAFSAILLLSGRSGQRLCALRIVSVPLLSASFFLLL